MSSIVLSATINVLAISTLVLPGLVVDLIASYRINPGLYFFAIIFPSVNSQRIKSHIQSDTHIIIHHNFTVVINDSHIIRSTTAMPIVIMLAHNIFSMRVDRLIELSANHDNGERRIILSNGKLRATTVRMMLTHIHCRIALLLRENQDSILTCCNCIVISELIPYARSEDIVTILTNITP